MCDSLDFQAFSSQTRNMKRTAQFKFINALLLCALFSFPTEAAFEPLPVGGRAAGMSEAYTAIVDDVYSLYYNPAGILQLQRPEIGSYYSQLFVGLTDNSEISRTFIGYGQPLGKDGKLGGIGASYLALDLPGLYKEEAIALTYGREFRRLWNLGGTVKLLRKRIGSDEFTNNAIDPVTGAATGTADPLLAGNRSESAIGLDFGLQYRLTRAYALGVALRNLNSPDLGLGSDKDRVPSVISLALARRLRRGSLDVELTNWKSAESNVRFAIGGEHWFENNMGLRAGAGFGSRNYTTISFGASYRMESLQLDYATVYPLQGIEDTLGIQQISLSVRLGKPPVDPLEQQLIKEKEQRIRAETEARYAKAERDRLKKQLFELTKAKTETEREKEKLSAERALLEAQKQAHRKATTERDLNKRSKEQELFKAYTTALSDYNEKVRRGIGLKEKKGILEKISNRFKNKDIDVSTVIRELKSIRVLQTRAKKDFELSMNFYRRLAAQGASIEERRNMLERIIQKYKGTGIKIRPALEEMDTLK